MLAFGSLLSSLLIIGISIGIIVLNMEVYNQLDAGASESDVNDFKNKIKISTVMAGTLGGIFLLLSLASVGFFTIFVLNR